MQKLMKAFWFLFVVMTSQSAFAVNGGFPNFSKAVIFGDSLSDVGNYVASNPSPIPCLDVSAPVTNLNNGPTFNRKLWPQYLFSFPITAASLKHPEGNDWAVVGDSSFEAVSQVDNYLATHFYKADPDTVYAIFIGADDFVTPLFSIISDIAAGKDVDVAFAQFAEQVPKIIAGGAIDVYLMISKLWNAGARNFLVFNLPDLSRTPVIEGAVLAGVATPAQQAAIRTAFAAWNQVIFNPLVNSDTFAPLATLSSQATAAGKPITIYQEDVFRFFNEVANDPTNPKFGFALTEPFIFLGIPIGFIVPNNATYWCTNPFPNGQTSNDPQADQFIFFNFIHPTSHAHSVLANDVATNTTIFQPVFH